MKKRVLIADDTALFREMIKNALGSEEYQIVGEAVSGGQAVDMYKEKKPDLMILDINMPKMNGIDALAAVMDYDPTKVIRSFHPMYVLHGELTVDGKKCMSGDFSFAITEVGEREEA